jgi:hypothetical protein
VMGMVVTWGGGELGVSMEAMEVMGLSMGLGLGICTEYQADGITRAAKVGGTCPRATHQPRATAGGPITLIVEAVAHTTVDMQVMDGAIYLAAFVETEVEEQSIIFLFADWDASDYWCCVVCRLAMRDYRL